MPKAATRIEQLTKARCDALQPEAARYRVTDKEVKALKFVVEPTGRKFWSVRYVTHDGKNSEKTLGDWPGWLPERARDAASAVRSEVRGARADPGKAKREERTKAKARRLDTFEGLADAYMEATASGVFGGRDGKPKRASTITKERLNLAKHVRPALGKRPVTEIKRSELVALRDAIAGSSGRSMANSCLEVIRQVFAYGCHLDDDAPNPAQSIKHFKLASREKVATDDALRLLWLEMDRVKARATPERDTDQPAPEANLREGYATAQVIQLAILTLQRRGEVASIARVDVDLTKGLWTCPPEKRKEGRENVVPLSAAACEILADAFRRSNGPWAFPSLTTEGHMDPKTVSRFLKRLREWKPSQKAVARAEASLAELRAKSLTAKVRRDIRLRTESLAKALAAYEQGLARAASLAVLKDLTPHDLRGTARTHLTGDRLQIDGATAERILGHVVGSKQQNVYDRNTYLGPKRNALEAWAGEVRRIVYDDAPASNVLSISSHKGA
jgi:integrase